jgi:hypothetical protein
MSQSPGIRANGLYTHVAAGSSLRESHPYFEENLVVSRDAEGKPVSRYGDFSWSISSLSTDGTSGANLFFFNSQQDGDYGDLVALIREQHKAIMWLQISTGKIRAQGTLQQSNYTLATWCTKALSHRISLFEILTTPTPLVDELNTLNRTYLLLTASLIKTLSRHGKQLGINKQISLGELKYAISTEKRNREKFRQTPLIPSRIYCAILRGLVESLDEIECDLDQTLEYYRQSMAATRDAPKNISQTQKYKYRAKLLLPVVEHMKSIGYNPKKEGALDRFITGRINFFQSRLMHTVGAFTGMRIGEVAILPLSDVVECFEDRGSTHYVIHGYTHKLERGVKKPTSWITCYEGYRAILLAQRIATTILKELDTKPEMGQEALLFCSTVNPFKKKVNRTQVNEKGRLIEEICPIVTQNDIDELNQLELDRSWMRDGIKVGTPWPLTFHQLRRSLSVYAHRSGMVSLPALKAQLQHITDEMRAYYADGYSRAVNLVFDKEHFSHEWNAAKAESSFFGYTLGLLITGDVLMGRGAEIMTEAISTRGRQETLRLFRQGKLAYKETVLGGCISIESCKTQPLEPIPFNCLEKSCVNQIVLRKRLDHVIQTQYTVVAALERDDRNSVEHRLELDNLRVLLKARSQLAEPHT